jgi:ribonuclease G
LTSKLALNVRLYETRLAVIEDGKVVEFHLERKSEPTLVGNIYRGKVIRMLPGMQAAFVDIGLDKAGFLYVTDILPNVWSLDEEFEQISSHLPDYRIENLLQEGQEVLVQVRRDPIGTKGPQLSTSISLLGHYLILLPFFNHIGISRRINNEKERERLKKIVLSSKPEGYGFIVRTASEAVEGEKVIYEMKKLVDLWAEILERKKNTPLSGLVHAEMDLCLRSLRDFFEKHTKRIIVDSFDVYRRLIAYAKESMPHLQNAIELYQGKKCLFAKLGIENIPSQVLRRHLWLKSGGYIIIEETEALVVIDINTGRFVGENNLEETVLKTNLEAVKEVGRQLRLRDLGGIIIIDFIDMQKERNRQKVLAALEKILKKDRSKPHISQMSELGLVEMTRKRTRQGLLNVLGAPCFCCQGRGYVKSKRTICYEIIRELEELQTLAQKIEIRAHPDLIRHIEEKEREIWQKAIEPLGKTVILTSKQVFNLEDYEIVEIKNK